MIRLGGERFSVRLLAAYMFVSQFIAVLGRGAVGVFIETSAKRGQVIKACLKGDIRNRKIPVCGEHGLGLLDAFMA